MLLVSICREPLHELEFVKPLEDILAKHSIPFRTQWYHDLEADELEQAQKVIICGTSLKDREYMEHLERFEWCKTITKPVLGICGGMQIIGMVHGGKLLRQTEIGMTKIRFTRPFLQFQGEKDVYVSHNYYMAFSEMSQFEIYARTEGTIPQAVKHKQLDLYGVLFHPEVRQRQLILNFAKL